MFRALIAAFIAYSFSLSAQITFTSSGTFVVPPGVENMTVELVGPGGNGASNGGGGGGGGAYASAVYEVTPGTNYSVVVGTGGSGLATSISALGISAGAGGNATITPNPNIGGGGQGGVAQGGDVNRNGGPGGGGYYTYFGGGGGGAAGPTANGGVGGNTIVWTGGNCLTPGGAAGVGGGSPAGDGGKGAGFTDNNCTVSNPAANGQSYGGGGGGGNGIGSAVGIGGGGYCRISWGNTTGISNLDINSCVPAPEQSVHGSHRSASAPGHRTIRLVGCHGPFGLVRPAHRAAGLFRPAFRCLLPASIPGGGVKHVPFGEVSARALVGRSV